MRQKPFDVRTITSDVRQKASDVRQKASDEKVTLSAVADYPRIGSVREYRRKPFTFGRKHLYLSRLDGRRIV